MDEEQREHLETLRRANQERLRKLEQQAAAFGLYAPAYVLMEIDTARAEIARIERELGMSTALDETPPAAARAALARPLPLPPTPLIGRALEIAAVLALLRHPEARLVTLTGLGGIGKTRLALQIAADLVGDFADGVCYVALASIRDPALVPTTIAQAFGVRDTAGQPLPERLADYLRDRQALLLLDNFEQVVAAAPVVSQILAAAPAVKALVTSRALLRIAGEHEFAVPPMALPPHPPALAPSGEAGEQGTGSAGDWKHFAQYPAIELFVERAQAARPGFTLTSENADAVAAICVRLDGLPLAIELAAARSKLLAPPALLARLDSRLALLTTGARDLPARQQTLRGTIDWSYNLLHTAEQTLFARLAVFVGGFTLETAEAVAAELKIENEEFSTSAGQVLLNSQFSILDSLEALVDNSLLRQLEGLDGEPRFTMLETIREYALERLAERGEAAALQQRHASYYLALAEQAEPETLGSKQAKWLERLELEHDNLRAALSWAIGQHETETALRLGAALWRYWWTLGHLSEGRRWLSEALALPGAGAESGQAETSARAWALRGAGLLAHMQGDYGQASALYAASLVLQRELGDKAGIAAVQSGQGHVALRLGDYQAARSYFNESLALQRELGSQWGVANALGDLGSVARLLGDHAQADALNAERLVLVQNLGNKRDIAAALASIGHVAIEQGDYQRAKTYYEQSLVILRELNARGNIAILLGNLGIVARGQGDSALAKQRCAESLTLFRELGDRRGAAIALGYLGDTLLHEGDIAGAQAQHAASLAIYRDLNERLGVADRLESMAAVLAAQGRDKRAARLWGAAEALRAGLGTPMWPAARPAYDRAVATARAQLGEEAFAAAWAAGRALTLEQAIDEALNIGATQDESTD